MLVESFCFAYWPYSDREEEGLSPLSLKVEYVKTVFTLSTNQISLYAGNDDYIFLRNFDGSIISGFFEVIEGSLRRLPPVVGGKKSPVSTRWNLQ